MVFSNVSLMGQSTSQINLLKDLNGKMADLQRQIATQRKADTFSGLEGDSLRIQRMRAESNKSDIFMRNIDTTNIKIELMTQSMTKSMDLARDVINNIQTQTRGGEIDLNSLQVVAEQALNFVMDIMNTEHNGNYLFAGSDTTNEPLADMTAMNTNIQTEMTNWLAGGQTPTALLANIDGFTDSQLGYSATINTAGSVITQIDTRMTVDYTVLGNNDGFKEIIQGLGIAANLEFPDPATDIGTESDFYEILNSALTTLINGVNKLEGEAFALGGKHNLIQSIAERHVVDKATYEEIIADIEIVDAAEAISKFQALDIQLQASYQTTSLLNQLSLINFI